MFKRKSKSVKSAEDCALLCSMKRALKLHPVFAKGGEGIMVLKAPEKYPPARYGSAILSELYPTDDFRRDDIGFMYISKGDKLSKSKRDEHTTLPVRWVDAGGRVVTGPVL